MFNFLKNKSGQGIVETLMGGAIIGVTAVGLGVAINSMAKSRAKTQAVSNAVALESTVVGTLQDPTIYANYKTELKNGQIDQFRSNFRMPTPGWGGGSIGIGNTAFTQSGNTCTGFPTNKDCVINLNLQVTSTGGTPPTYAFAYQIQTNGNNVNMVPLGSAATDSNGDGYGDTFAADAYRMIVPSSIFNEDIGCEAGGIAASGFDFDSGKLLCLSLNPTSLTCPAGQYPVGLELDPDNQKVIRFKCQALHQIGCDNGSSPNDRYYGLNKFDPAALASGSPLTGSECVFVARTTEPALTGPVGSAVAGSRPLAGTNGSGASYRYGIKGPGGEAYGTFCPVGYNARITLCQAVLDNTPGMPPRCPTGFPRNCTGETNPDWQAGVWYGPAATYDGPLVAPVNVGQAIGEVSGNKARCYLNNSGQPPNAGWTGYVNMAVVCEADTNVYPPTKPAKLISGQ